jgi:hypothetical protein
LFLAVLEHFLPPVYGGIVSTAVIASAVKFSFYSRSVIMLVGNHEVRKFIMEFATARTPEPPDSIDSFPSFLASTVSFP